MPPVFVAVPHAISVIIQGIILREGGYVHDWDDSGGETNYGITRRTLDLWDPDMRVGNITAEVAHQIYYQFFWEKYDLYHLGRYWDLKEFMFDWMIHSGPRNAVRHLQRFVGAKPDGVLGPNTMSRIYIVVEGQQFMGKLCDYRIKVLIRLARRRPKDMKFLEGWFNRVTSFRYLNVPYI